MTHTSTPWTLTHIEGSNFAVQEFEIRGMFGDKQNVTPIFNKDRFSIDVASIFVSPDDADFIVRACNTHDALVEYFRASGSMQAILGHEEATAELERKAEERYEAARKAAAEALKA